MRSSKPSVRRPPPVRTRPSVYGRPGRSLSSVNRLWIGGALLGAFLVILLGWIGLGTLHSRQSPPTPTLVVDAMTPTVTPSPVTSGSVVPATKTPAPPTPVSTNVAVPLPDVPSLQRLMLELINTDRRAEGLNPVAWDTQSAQIGAAHAQEMATSDYLSHWNLQGYGPDVRYSLSGGSDAVMENVYLYEYRFDDGRPAPISDWPQIIRAAHASLMESPGHQANILDSSHTHVGIGIAYNATTGNVRIAQEFINRYVKLDSTPRTARLGDSVDVKGTLLAGASNPLINLAYETFPQTRTVDALRNATDLTYQSPAEIVSVINPTVTGGQFAARIKLASARGAGLYHIRLWTTTSHDANVLAADVIIKVQ